jgi:hypothetical protein
MVFLYGPPETETGPGRKGPIAAGVDLIAEYPVYQRMQGAYTLEGISYTLDAIQGGAGFDTPSTAVEAAIKLAIRLKLREKFSPRDRAVMGILIHEPDQGHFPLWFARYLGGKPPGLWVFSGRNILALEASRHNFIKGGGQAIPETVPTVDPVLGTDSLESGAFNFIAAFPEIVPKTDRIAAYWTGIGRLLRPGGIFLIALPSLQAGAFDRIKPEGFTRLGDIKRKGCRVLGYTKMR